MRLSKDPKRESRGQNDGKSGVVVVGFLASGDISSVTSGPPTRPEAFGISLAIEGLVLGLLLAAPLFTSIAQPHLRPMLPTQISFFRPKPELRRESIVAARVTVHTPEIFDPFQSPEHGIVVAGINEDEGFSAPDPGVEGPYTPGGTAVPGDGIKQLVKEPQIPSQPVQVANHPLRVREGILEAQLIRRVEPQYPALAKQTKTEGTVRIHAIISRDGRITSLDILSGHPLLVQAALEAVSQWRYRPTMLNGEPVEVETSITVIFRLHN